MQSAPHGGHVGRHGTDVDDDDDDDVGGSIDMEDVYSYAASARAAASAAAIFSSRATNADSLPGLGSAPPPPSISVFSPAAGSSEQGRRRDVPAMHSSASVARIADRAAPSPEPTIPAGSKAAPAGGTLGSFMYVRNSRFDASSPTPDNPAFWVGRVAEIMRGGGSGGRMRLHWHREVTLGSGLYVPTNNYFPERASLLSSFKAVIFDAAQKAWRTYPALEIDTVENAAVLSARVKKAAAAAAAATAASVAAGGGGGGAAGGGLAVGAFVFLRNARFDASAAETPIMPRYWVARITGITVQDPAGERSAGPGLGTATESANRMLINGVSTPTLTPTVPPSSLLALTTPDGRLRLQWHRETAVGSALYVPTNHIFFEHKRLVSSIGGGGMRFDARTKLWCREGVNGGAPAPLVFPGEENSASAEDAEKGGAAAAAPPPPPEGTEGGIALEAGVFAFLPNTKFTPSAVETPTAPRFWVARVMGVQPAVPGRPSVAKVQCVIAHLFASRARAPSTKPTLPHAPPSPLPLSQMAHGDSCGFAPFPTNTPNFSGGGVSAPTPSKHFIRRRRVCVEIDGRI